MSFRIPEDRIREMHAAYLEVKSLSAVAKRFGRNRRSMGQLFERRGYSLIPSKPMASRLPDGRIAPLVPHTDAEIHAIVARMEKLCIPRELLVEWRKWPLSRRAWFVRLAREKLQLSNDRPAGPFSEGLMPFDYGTPAAWAIVRRINHGLDSRRWRVKINLCSQGVIWRDTLWFWERFNSTGYTQGPYRENGRPALHQVIWSEAHGAVPPGYVIRFRDGNRNNHALENLVLASRDSVCRENQAAALLRASRDRTAALVNLVNQKGKRSMMKEVLRHGRKR